MEKGLSVNRMAWRLLQRLVENSYLYKVKVEKTDSETTIIDAGIDAEGGFRAGELVTEICMGGCGKAKTLHKQYGDLGLPSIFVYTDHPVIATLGSQYAGWQISEGDYFAIGSGPARALALKPKDIYEEIDYKDDFDKAVVVLETDKHPPEKLIQRLARDCNASPENLAVILTPTASIAGATQVSGRIVETGIHKLWKLGLDPNVILHACGTAPIPPIHPKFAQAMARTNDAILYGGTTYYVVNHENEKELEKILKNAPSMASKAYGEPFSKIFEEANYDFYSIDPNLFAPAIVVINNVKTGNTYSSGEMNARILMKSFCVKNA